MGACENSLTLVNMHVLQWWSWTRKAWWLGQHDSTIWNHDKLHGKTHAKDNAKGNVNHDNRHNETHANDHAKAHGKHMVARTTQQRHLEP